MNQFNIIDFGAVGDNRTDCTAAIQKALDAAALVEGEVIVPPGKYKTGKLKMGCRTRLTGSSGWNFRSDGLSTLVLNDPDANCLIDITGAFGCALSGICLDGQRLGKNVHGVYLYWEKYNGGSEEDTPAFDDCRIGNFSGDGIHLEHIWCFSVRHCMIHRNVGCGLFIEGWDAFILDNWFSVNENGGIRGGEWVASVTATGNRIEWNRTGGIILGSGDSVQINGCFFDRSFGPAIRLGGEKDNFADCAITGNIFRRNGCSEGMNFASEDERCHVYFENVRNVTLTGNTCRNGVNDQLQGERSPEYGFVLKHCNYVVVQSNTLLDGTVKQGIVYDGLGNNIVKDNLY